ncbi:unnamed protein product [Discula destructiva]
MKFWTTTRFALGLLGLTACVASEDELVVELDKSKFPAFIKSNSVVMVDYYAPWCGHCVKFAPKFESAAKKLQQFGVDVKLAKVDCTRQARLCQEHNIRAYPTMKVFKNNEELYHDYEGPRRVSAIVEFMERQTLPTVSDLQTKQQHDDFLFKEKGEIVLMAYFDSNDDHHPRVLAAAAEKLHEDFPLGKTSDVNAAQAAGVPFPSLVLYRPDDEGKVVFDKVWDVDAIKEFAKTGHKPLIGETGAESWRRYTSGSDGPTVFMFHKTEDDRRSLKKHFSPVAKKYAGSIQFTTAEIPDFQGFANYLHLRTEPTDSRFPALAIYNGSNKKKYPFDNQQGLTEVNIDNFVKSFLDGSLKPSIMSEDIPNQDQGPVTTVVANSYDDIVMDANKDVLLYFYRHDCPYCNAMNPVYDTLGSMYKTPERAERVVVAKMNLLLNDVHEDIPYVPYVKLYKAGDKSNPIVYSGDRSARDMVNFIKEHGAHAVDALQEHAVSDGAVHGDAAAGGEQQPLMMDKLHEQPMQGRTDVKPLHDEL